MDVIAAFNVGPNVARIKLISKIIYNLESLFFGNVETPKSGLRVDLYGQISGKEVHLVYATPVLKMGNLTGFPAAIAAKLYAEGKIDGIGILPPESQDPNQYIKELEKIDIKIIYDDRGIPEIFDESKPYKLKFFEKYTYTIILISAQIIIICLFVFLFLWIFKVF